MPSSVPGPVLAFPWGWIRGSFPHQSIQRPEGALVKPPVLMCSARGRLRMQQEQEGRIFSRGHSPWSWERFLGRHFHDLDDTEVPLTFSFKSKMFCLFFNLNEELVMVVTYPLEWNNLNSSHLPFINRVLWVRFPWVAINIPSIPSPGIMSGLNNVINSYNKLILFFSKETIFIIGNVKLPKKALESQPEDSMG